MAIQIKIRRDTTQNWYEINPILADGEMGIEHLDNGKNKIKIGNGVDTYSNLEYFADAISYLDILNKPQINNIELIGNVSLADLGIQPVGSYASYEDVVNGLALKADIDNTYTKADIDTFFNNLLKIPAIEDQDGKYLKVNQGEIVWSNIDGDIVSIDTLNEELAKKVDKIDGYSLISISELQRLSTVTNYDDAPIKEDLELLKAEVDTKASINSLDNYVLNESLNDKLQSYALKSDISSKANASDLSNHINNTLNPHNVTKEQVGLGNVNNTSDINKPISIAMQTALNEKQHVLSTGYGISINEDNVITNTVPNVQSDWNVIEGNAAILNKPNLSTVATSGSYNDLTDKPHIPVDYILPPATQTDLGGVKVGSGLVTTSDGTLSVEVAVGNYNDLIHKPSIGGITLIEGQTAEDLDLATAKATQSELNLKADITYVEDNYVKKSDLELDLNNKADKSTTLAGYGITDAYTKTEVDSKLSSVYKFKGSVSTYNELPLQNNSIGDVYNVEDTGANYAWTGSNWDKLSETIDLTSYLTKSEASTNYATKEELSLKANSSDLTNYVTSESLTSALNLKANIADLSTVATSGSYNDLTDKPAIPSEYTLPIASSSVLGGIKVGSGLAVSEDGTLSSTTSGGTTDYTALSNKPQINGIELSGNKTATDLNLQLYTILADNTDFNTIEETGLFKFTIIDGSVNLNQPILNQQNKTYNVSCIMYDSEKTNGIQTVYSREEMSFPVYGRIKDNNVWQPWYQIAGSGLDMPSKKSIDISLQPSEFTYTAPANGYIYLDKQAQVQQYIQILEENNIYGQTVYAPIENSRLSIMLPIKKGSIVNIAYTADGATNAFKFIYANSEVPMNER